MPDNRCYTEFCDNSAISQSIPLPEATLFLESDDGHVLSGVTDCKGEYTVANPEDKCYVLYAKKDDIRVKQAIIVGEGITDAGEANAYTTAQVIIYEVAKVKYPGRLTCKDIPTLVPTKWLLQAVENALRNCRDPQQDGDVIREANCVVSHLFNSGGGGNWSEGDGEQCLLIVPEIHHCTLVEGECVTSDKYFWGEMIQFSVANAGEFPEGTTFSWNFGDENAEEGSSEVNHAYEYQGSYGEGPQTFTVTVTARHKRLCNGVSSGSTSVQVGPLSGGND